MFLIHKQQHPKYTKNTFPVFTTSDITGCIWFVPAWLLIALAVNVPMLYAGRVVAGFCVGIVSLCFPVYLGETLQPEVRGMLGLLPTAFGNVGKFPFGNVGKFAFGNVGKLAQPAYQQRCMCCISFGSERPDYRQRVRKETARV
jgi:hypothetical protein